MVFWRLYLKSKRGVFVFYTVFGLLLCGSFLLYRLPLRAVLYPVLLGVLLGVGMLAADIVSERRRHRQFVSLLGQHADCLAALPDPRTPAEADCLLLAEHLRQDTETVRSADAAAYRDMTDYYTVWAHQIKTPISAMKLNLQNSEAPEARQLSADLFRIEQYVEMVLAFLRLGNEERGGGDYVFRTCGLDGMIRAVLRKFAPEFILRRLSLSFTPTEVSLVTDEKWLSFVIEQVLSNALKYTPAGGITIGMSAPSVLCIGDTGIGIAEEDLPRIFERGYTGYNGRIERSATGLGLYLCARICANLGISIRAESEPGKGTRMYLDFSQKRITAE